MADTLDYFDVERGLGIEEKVQFITGSGVPGLTGDSTTVPKGSYYSDYNSTPAALYWKHADGTGQDKWKKVASTEDISTEISWREPVEAHDALSTVLPTQTPGNPDTRDTISITDGDRVLFSNLTVSPNVYIYDQATGTYIEDVNEESVGDRLYVYDGEDPPTTGLPRKTYAGTIWTYNKNNQWVLSEKATDTTELGFIRQFVGKSDVGDLSATEPEYDPTPANLNHIANTDVLTEAIRKLDAQIGAELVAGNYVSAGEDTNDAILTLDAAIGDLAYNNGQISLDSQTGAAVNIDALETDLYVEARWIVYVTDGSDQRSWTVTAMHDGTASVGASNTDRTIRARMRIGTPNPDWKLSVNLSGTFPNQVMNLDLDTDGDTVNIRAVRTVVEQ